MTDIPIYRATIGGLGPWELVIILVIILIVFGAGRLPQIGGAIGQALKNFKKSTSGDSEQPPAGSPPKNDDQGKPS